MKKASLALLVGFIGTFLCNSVKAEFDSWGLTTSHGTSTGSKFYRINSITGNATLVTEECDFQDPYGYCYQVSDVKYNDSTGKLEYKQTENRDGNGPFVNNYTVQKWYSYDLNTGEKTEIDAPWTSDYTSIGTIPLVTKKVNGEIHIGKNSWITKEDNGRQKVWAKDVEGNAIPIDYTNGSKLLINGRDVEQSINNVGALSAALTGLPTVPTETNLACGLGTGTHGGDFAFSGGCSSKVNEKLSINYAASMTIPGQDYAGDFEDTFSARAGFVWKLGKSFKPTQISFKDKKIIDRKISNLQEDNKNLKAKNDEIISQNQKLLARLEKLENIALKFQSSSEMISVATKD
ncbi:YadA C-terminal domain-containing protein [Prochlorococcus sp. AH-736-K15]|nr:YadA C-terminal domain-containing protein [Prochlorococcus sp. AH-736-K15]